MTAPTFPPLLKGVAAPRGVDPFAKAVSLATTGCDAGTVVWSTEGGRLRAAMVFAPETPLRRATAMVFALGSALADALGALGPPEIAVQFRWPGELRVNGAVCGRLRADGKPREAGAIPDWLVVGIEVVFTLPHGAAPGDRPDETALAEEGCVDLAPVALLESWSRHALVWINRWEEDGMAPLHRDWTGRLVGLGAEVEAEGRRGVFVGLDEDGAMLLKRPEGVAAIPLTTMFATEAA